MTVTSASEQDSQRAAVFMADHVRTFADRMRSRRVAPLTTRAEIRERLAPYTFTEPLVLEDALEDVTDMLAQWTLHGTHPRYLGLFVPNTDEASVWGDTITALYNPQLGAWWHAPAASEIEIHTLQFLAALLGFEARCAHFTTGGSEANLTALLAALTTAFPSAAQDGLGAAGACARVYVSAETHHSMHKAVRIAGLGTTALSVLPCNTDHQLDVEALRSAIQRDVASGCTPVMVVGTVGSTTSGAIDDLCTIGGIASEYSAWFHVDAAWGGVAAFSSILQPHLRGINRADSVSWDAHKALPVPLGAGMFFCRHAGVLDRLLSVDAGYVPDLTEGNDDPYRSSVQWSRRFIGLKVFLSLAVTGRTGICARVERQLRIAAYLRGRLLAAGWVVANRTPLPLVCFAHPALESPGTLTRIAEHVALRGRAWISEAILPHGPVLRACITHGDTSEGDIDTLCEELAMALAAETRHASEAYA